MPTTDQDMPSASSLEHIDKLMLVYGRLEELLFDLSVMAELDASADILTESAEHCRRAAMILRQLNQALVKLPQKRASGVIVVGGNLTFN